MPRIVKWDEKLKYVRPQVSSFYKFLSPFALNKFEKLSRNDQEELDNLITDISTELWYTNHLSHYNSPYIDMAKKKEVPEIWEI